MTWHVDNILKLKKKIKAKIKKNQIELKKNKSWHVTFNVKNIKYLNTVSTNDQIDENEDLIECKTKMRTKLNKNNKNKDQMFI